MYALIGRVEIKPSHEAETATMAREHGPSLVANLSGKTGYWARAVDESGRLIQHSVWLFDNEEDARAAETVFSSLRAMEEAPAVFISVDVCDVVAQF